MAHTSSLAPPGDVLLHDREVPESTTPTTTASAHPLVGVAPSKKDRLIKEIACHSTLVIAGWSDASSGPLIPYIQAFYGISYTVGTSSPSSPSSRIRSPSASVSMLFVGQMVGFLSAGFANTHLTERFGLGRVITIGALIQASGYVFLIPAFPFPVMPVCYAIIGFGMALQDAAANTYVATLPNAEQKFGYLHGSYGVGALVCPLAATAYASSGHKFSYFYAISIGLAFVNVATLVYAFRWKFRIEEHHNEVAEMNDGVELSELGREMERDGEVALGGTEEGKAVAEAQTETKVEKKEGALMQVLKSKTMWVFSIFILVYVGAEVSMGGWIVTFVIDERNGGPSAGYVATGYWAGLALGRVVLPPVNMFVGEKRVVFFYVAIVIGLELAIWFAHNLIANAVVAALVGFILGPLYPNTMSIATKVLPRHLHNSAIGFIAAFGQAGSALFPFMTGALAQKYSTYALQPMMIVLSVIMGGIWWFVPDVQRKVE